MGFMNELSAFTIYAKDKDLQGLEQINAELAKLSLDARNIVSISRILVRSGYAIVTVYYTKE
jgi:hypothetical protein